MKEGRGRYGETVKRYVVGEVVTLWYKKSVNNDIIRGYLPGKVFV